MSIFYICMDNRYMAGIRGPIATPLIGHFQNILDAFDDTDWPQAYKPAPLASHSWLGKGWNSFPILEIEGSSFPPKSVLLACRLLRERRKEEPEAVAGCSTVLSQQLIGLN